MKKEQLIALGTFALGAVAGYYYCNSKKTNVVSGVSEMSGLTMGGDNRGACYYKGKYVDCSTIEKKPDTWFGN
jgi:hypothetical protein